MTMRMGDEDDGVRLVYGHRVIITSSSSPPPVLLLLIPVPLRPRISHEQDVNSFLIIILITAATAYISPYKRIEQQYALQQQLTLHTYKDSAQQSAS